MNREQLQAEAEKCADRLVKAFIMPAQEVTFRASVEAGFYSGAEYASPKWVRVEDKLPEDNGEYLVYIVNETCVVPLYMTTSDWFSVSDGWEIKEEWRTLFWMPLPPAPINDKQ